MRAGKAYIEINNNGEIPWRKLFPTTLWRAIGVRDQGDLFLLQAFGTRIKHSNMQIYKRKRRNKYGKNFNIYSRTCPPKDLGFYKAASLKRSPVRDLEKK